MKVFMFFILCLSIKFLPAQESTEKNDKLLKASEHLAIDYLINSSDEGTGLWITPHIYNQMKYEKTGKILEVEEPVYEVAGYEDAWAWVDRPSPADPYRKVYEKYKRAIYKKVGTRKVKVEETKIIELEGDIPATGTSLSGARDERPQVINRPSLP